MKENKIINNQYLIIKLIGSGGIANVYKAWDIALHRFVAVKQIHKKYTDDAKFVDMFRREAINTAKLEHENIVRVTNLIRDRQNSFYIIMDYVNGVDLEYLIKKCKKLNKKIPSYIALYITSEVLKALDYAHNFKESFSDKEFNIVHRDLSPGNIMLYFDGRIKLTDFGIAKAGDSQVSSGEEGRLAGKISYMSPEQARGKIDLDARSDLFSCGLVLYELLTGEKAYKGEDPHSTWQKAKGAKIDFKKLKKKGIPGDIRDIASKALEKSTMRRYSSAAKMFLDIKRYLNKKGKTHDLKRKYKQFIIEILRDELKVAEKEAKRKTNGNINNIIKERNNIESEQITNENKSGVEESEEYEMELSKEEIKDKSKKNSIIKIAIGVILLGFILFIGLDTYMQYTPLGKKINSLMFPIVLKVNSIPSNAEIHLINRNNVDIISKRNLSNRTPVYIRKIEPGIYTLKISKDKYGEEIRKVVVYGKKREEQSISIAGSRVYDDIYVVSFNVAVEVESEPSDAQLFIDGKKAGRTPFAGKIDTGRHSLYLEREGYEPLGVKEKTEGYTEGACILNTLNSVEDQEDVDFQYWDLNEINDNGERRIFIQGSLEKLEKPKTEED